MTAVEKNVPFIGKSLVVTDKSPVVIGKSSAVIGKSPAATSGVPRYVSTIVTGSYAEKLNEYKYEELLKLRMAELRKRRPPVSESVKRVMWIRRYHDIENWEHTDGNEYIDFHGRKTNINPCTMPGCREKSCTGFYSLPGIDDTTICDYCVETRYIGDHTSCGYLSHIYDGEFAHGCKLEYDPEQHDLEFDEAVRWLDRVGIVKAEEILLTQPALCQKESSTKTSGVVPGDVSDEVFIARYNDISNWTFIAEVKCKTCSAGYADKLRDKCNSGMNGCKSVTSAGFTGIYEFDSESNGIRDMDNVYLCNLCITDDVLKRQLLTAILS